MSSLEQQNGAVFLALQHDVEPSKMLGLLETLGIRRWVYLGEDSTWRVGVESVLPQRIQRIQIADALNMAAVTLRDLFIDWIGDLSLANDSREWWASELAAKNPYYMLYERICLLAVGRELLAKGFDQPTLVVSSTPGLLAEIASHAHQVGILTKNVPFSPIDRCLCSLKERGKRHLMYALRRIPPVPQAARLSEQYEKLLEIHPGFRKRVLKRMNIPEGDPFTGERSVLLFTWVDHRNFASDGAYKDPHLGPLPQMLKERGYRVAYVPRVLHTAPYQDTVEKLHQTGERFFFPDWFIDRNEWIACREAAARFSPTIPEDSTLGGVPVYRLTMEHIEQTRQCLADTLLYDPLIAGLAASGIRPSQIIHTAEGHSWEHALGWSVRHHLPGTRVFGYDNVTFSRMVLSMYPSKKEYGVRPLPDRLVTNGPLYRDVLLREGMSEERVVAGCALRHTYLWKEVDDRRSAVDREPGMPVRVLVATAIGLGDSVELVAKAAEAFGGNPEYEIMVKCHPLVNIDVVKQYLGILSSYENISFVSEPVDLLLRSAHILLYTFTTVCYEALLMGVAPIFVRSDTFVNLDKLDVAPDVRWVATTPDDLRNVAREISLMSPEERRVWRENASAVVRRALAPTTAECLNAFLFPQVS